jgi:hypothetical protein
MKVTTPNRGRATPMLVAWLLTNVVGTIMAVAALREVARNWLALRHAAPRESDVLAEILIGNLYQQVSRIVMEALCWTAGLIAYIAPDAGSPRTTASAVIGWVLVGFRIMLITNSTVEYFSNRNRRDRLVHMNENAAHGRRQRATQDPESIQPRRHTHHAADTG